MGNIQDIIVFLNILLQLIYHFVICHGPQQPDIPPPVQCYGRCLAKCSEENSQISLNQCRKNCRKYGQQGLCPKEDSECWGKCKDLSSKKAEGPPLSPPTEVQANINNNYTIDVSWKPGIGSESETVPVYMIRLQAEFPKRKSAQIFSRGLSHKGMAFPSAENVCGPINIRLAAVSTAKGIGVFTNALNLEEKKPQIPAKMQLFAATYNDTPFIADGFQINGTLDVELLFKFDGWPFGLEDLEVIPIFHLLSCAEPDLNQAMPVPEFNPGSRPDTVTTHLGADILTRRCRFVYAVEEVHSNRCSRQFTIPAGQKDYESIEFNCNTVTGSDKAPNGICKKDDRAPAPICGQFENFNYTVIGQTIDPKTNEKSNSVNITFEPLRRIINLKPKYYVALYGNAVDYKDNDERFMMGVNMTNVLGQESNCDKFEEDKSCKHLKSNNSIILNGLKKATKYGVVICAVLDTRNLTFPEVNTTDKSIKPTAFGIDRKSVV